MEQHRSDPNCSTLSCRMDPIGFGFENFDAIGAGASGGDFDIDASGKLQPANLSTARQTQGIVASKKNAMILFAA